MARITIVPIDGTILVDGNRKSPFPFDLSTCDVPPDVHALQWYDTRGWIEFRDDNDPFTPKPANQEISELPTWVSACVALWEAYVEYTPPAAPQDQPASTGTQTL